MVKANVGIKKGTKGNLSQNILPNTNPNSALTTMESRRRWTHDIMPHKKSYLQVLET
jgi:hypothetical protein